MSYVRKTDYSSSATVCFKISIHKSMVDDKSYIFDL